MARERILVVAPSWVGDMVMAQVLFASLARTRRCRIDVLAPNASLPVASRMPEVSECIAFDLGHGEFNLRKRLEHGARLKQRGYDQAIVLPNSAKSALVPLFARIPRRTGFLGEMRYFLLNDLRMLNKRTMPRMIDRFMALGDEPGAPAPLPRLDVDTARQAALVKSLDIDAGGPVVALCPGAEFGEAKRWPAAHFADIARHAIAGGASVWLFGGPGDREAGEEIVGLVGASPGLHDLTGRTSLTDAIDLLALARVVVTNDSGLMHVAAATGRRTLVLYGSTSPDFTPPLSDDARVFRLGLDCSPCFERTCPLGHLDCLRRLLPETLYAAIDEAIA